MTIERKENFCCSVLNNDRAMLSFSDASSDIVVRIARSFSASEYWNEAVSSVAASFLPIGLCLNISNSGIASYLYLEDRMPADFFITVSALAPVPVKRVNHVRFRRHSAPMIRRVSCGNLSSRCTAFTL